jgi:sec-independent protein translocase protein TatB
MFEIGWAELLVIGVVALIVIGPEDLPQMFRQVGRFTAKLRSMGREFQRAMDQAAKDSGVKDVAKDLKSVTSPKAMGLDAVKAAADKFEKWDPVKNAAKPTVAKVASAAGEAAADAAEDALTSRTATALASMTPAPAAVSTLTPVSELADKSILGPATKALYDKQAARAAVMAESAAKLKAIDEAPEAAAPEPVAAKSRAAKTAAPEVAAAAKPKATRAKAVASEPKAPRKAKPKKGDEA